MVRKLKLMVLIVNALHKSITFKTIKVVLNFLSGEKKASWQAHFFLIV